MTAWSPSSWKTKPSAHPADYAPGSDFDDAITKLSDLPPLVTSWEIEQLKGLLAEAQLGRRFVLQGGDCAETIADCRESIITSKLKILLQMSLVLVQATRRPVVRIGRFAGQYAKPRSSPTETKDGLELPSYFGDLYNRPEFTAAARRVDPALLVSAYEHAALTLNFVRALVDHGFGDLHHPEYWDMSFLERGELGDDLRAQYTQASVELGEAIRFVEALGEKTVESFTRAEFFTSHEGLNLHYEEAQTRQDLRKEANGRFYDFSTHLPWIGDRTRALGGAHVEFFRGIANPVGLKAGPSMKPEDLRDLAKTLNPDDEPGKLVVITRLGAGNVEAYLPKLIEQMKDRRVLWVVDPMHGNTVKTKSGYKTRHVDEIFREIERSFAVHKAQGSWLGGIHFELTGEDVTECLGSGVSEGDLSRNNATACDPRLNYTQSLELAFRLGSHLRDSFRT
ncbi:MAG: 3-deoxy-7-phosphoheptulonate synthase class II [Polyangiaceae bacterium]